MPGKSTRVARVGNGEIRPMKESVRNVLSDKTVGGVMRLEQLAYFVAAADAGSISAAAQRLELSQPAVSAALRSLEEEVGGQLFRRGNQGIRLTPLGRLTYEDARKILGLVSGIRARGAEAGTEGVARVCAQPLLSFHLTGTIVLPFKALYPNINVFMRNVPNKIGRAHV